MNGSDEPNRWQQRIIRFPLVRLLIGLAMLAAVYVLCSVSVSMRGRDSANRIATAILFPTALLFAYAAYVRWIERRRVTELSRRGALRAFGIGAVIGSGLMTFTIGVLACVGCYRVVAFGEPRVLILGLCAQLPQTVLEELVFRALLFRICEEYLGSWAAMAIQAVIFGGIHLVNPDATLAGALAIAATAGVLLAAAFMLTRRVWLVWGLHFSWNYTQSAIFGGAVSGTGPSKGLLVSKMSGPAWLTGGDFGVEQSLIAIVACVATAVVLLVIASRRKQIVPFLPHRLSAPSA
jgi:membrane protease YdiL (CAAX protease family)